MRKALIVGIDNYTQCPLHGCCNDADAVARVLEENGDGSPNFSAKIENGFGYDKNCHILGHGASYL